jgi:hypothetical protein
MQRQGREREDGTVIICAFLIWWYSIFRRWIFSPCFAFRGYLGEVWGFGWWADGLVICENESKREGRGWMNGWNHN